MKPFINNYEDILELLDEKVHGVEWNRFYEEELRARRSKNIWPAHNKALS